MTVVSIKSNVWCQPAFVARRISLRRRRVFPVDDVVPRPWPPVFVGASRHLQARFVTLHHCSASGPYLRSRQPTVCGVFSRSFVAFVDSREKRVDFVSIHEVEDDEYQEKPPIGLKKTGH